MNPVASSMAAYQNITHSRIALKNLLVQNTVTGCTMMMNKALFGLILNPPEHCAMHDWWIALIAAAFGKIVYIDQPTILYRQHSQNAVGAKRAKGLQFYMHKWRTRKSVKKNYQNTFDQAQELLTRFSHQLTPSDKDLLQTYVSIPEKNKLGRICTIYKYKFYKNTLARTLGQFLSI